ncbi:hypothetical protein L208DRAFT_1132001, partial [Tricholoma matsutake]
IPMDPVLEINCQGSHVCYILKGVVYLANEHFTEHVITDTGMVWYHDGMFTGHSCVYN